MVEGSRELPGVPFGTHFDLALKEHRAGIVVFSDLMDGHATHRVALTYRPIGRVGSAMTRQERRVRVDPAESRDPNHIHRDLRRPKPAHEKIRRHRCEVMKHIRVVEPGSHLDLVVSDQTPQSSKTDPICSGDGGEDDLVAFRVKKARRKRKSDERDAHAA
jgi:hypothetical protein